MANSHKPAKLKNFNIEIPYCLFWPLAQNLDSDKRCGEI